MIIIKIAIVSGASSGIGAEFSKLIDNYSLDEIWLIARNEDNLKRISQSLKTKTRLLPLDLTKSEVYDTISKLLAEIKPEIKYLICSAGVGYNGCFDDLNENEINQMISLNCTSLTLLNKIALKYMNKEARIINVSSGAAFTPQPYFSVYSASKAYVNSFSRSLGYELRKKGIYVTVVCPGPVSTPFFSSLKNVKEYKKKFLISPKKVAIGALNASKKRKKLYTPTASMKTVHLIAKILPTSLILKFYK